MLSEEGRRFHHARTRCMVVETDAAVRPRDHPDHRWVPLHQLLDLLEHSRYANVQARSLVARLHSLFGERWTRNGGHEARVRNLTYARISGRADAPGRGGGRAWPARTPVQQGNRPSSTSRRARWTRPPGVGVALGWPR